MALVTIHTRLYELLQEARAIRQYCGDAISAMTAGAVSANAIVGLGQRLSASVSSVLVPAQAHVGLAEYAAVQLNDPQFALDARMAGLHALLSAAIAAARATVPVSPDGYLLKEFWHEDGSVSVRQMLPADTAALVVALATVRDNIPE